MTLKAVLLDVGGTLWINNLVIDRDAASAIWLRQLSEALPGVNRAALEAILASLLELEAGIGLQSTEGIEADIARVLAASKLTPGSDVARAVRRAMVVPAHPGIRRHPGFEALFETLAPLPLQRVVLSNTNWRDADGYWRDFRDFGVDQALHHIVTSVDAGQKKPHPAMFQAALAAAGCAGPEVVMVGNSEAADVAPARALGMRTIHVCIEEPLTGRSAADAEVDSLHEVASLIQEWTHE